MIMSVSEALEKLRRFVEDERRLSTLMYLRLVFKPLEHSMLHIAAEREAAYIPVYRVGERIYIPISSVRGALRSLAESLVKASLDALGDGIDALFATAHCELEGDIVRHVCALHDPTNFIKLIKELTKALESDKDLYRHFFTDEAMAEVSGIVKNVSEPMSVPRALEPVLAALCPICRLFGGPGLKSRISVLEVSPDLLAIHATTHVSIERSSGTARAGHLYTIERVSLSRLSVTLCIRNVKPGTLEAKILALLLEYLKTLGLSIGGHRSIGLGRFVLDPSESRGGAVNIMTISDAKTFIEQVVGLDRSATASIDQVIEYLRGQRSEL